MTTLFNATHMIILQTDCLSKDGLLEILKILWDYCLRIPKSRRLSEKPMKILFTSVFPHTSYTIFAALLLIYFRPSLAVRSWSHGLYMYTKPWFWKLEFKKHLLLFNFIVSETWAEFSKPWFSETLSSSPNIVSVFKVWPPNPMKPWFQKPKPDYKTH